MQTLLGNSKAFSGFSVDDLNRAKAFYSETLGLNVTTEAMGVLTLHLAGGHRVILYPKPNHLAATFDGENQNALLVRQLNNRGLCGWP